MRQQLKGLAIGTYLAAPVRTLRCHVSNLRLGVTRDPKRIDFYFQVDDPYSFLLAQLLPRFIESLDCQVGVYIVPAPGEGALPEPDLYASYALRDCVQLAKYWGLEAPRDVQPAAERIALANSVLCLTRPPREQLEIALEAARAIRAEEDDAMRSLALAHRCADAKLTTSRLAAAQNQLETRGHYLGGTIQYQGEWFWGIDRIQALQDRIRERTNLAVPPVLSRSSTGGPGGSLPTEKGLIPLEFFFSFRSPYAYLAVERVLDLAERYPVDLRIKPILPMVTRGLPLPNAKRMYIVRDAKREAERLNIPFGRICDPLGVGVERCLAAYFSAISLGCERNLLRSLSRGIWAEALDATDDRNMRQMCERAGLPWAQATAAFDSDNWHEIVAQNREELSAAGLWGVPSFRIGSFATWGQDRLTMIESMLQDHVATQKR